MSKNEHSADTIFTQQLKWTLKTLPNTGQLYPLAFFSQAIWHSRSCDLRRIMSAQLNKTLITPHHALFTWANVTRPHARHLPWWVCWPECRIHGRLPGPLRIHPDLAPLISPTVMISSKTGSIKELGKLSGLSLRCCKGIGGRLFSGITYIVW